MRSLPTTALLVATTASSLDHIEVLEHIDTVVEAGAVVRQAR